jgi:hypothetical protein
MLTRTLLALIFVAPLAACESTGPETNPFTGGWGMAAEYQAQTPPCALRRVVVNITESAGTLSATAAGGAYECTTIQGTSSSPLFSLQVRDMARNGNAITFRLQGSFGASDFSATQSGTLMGGVISGTSVITVGTANAVEGNFTMIRD